MIPLYIIEDFFFSVSRAVKIFGLIKRKVEFVLCVRFCLVAICVIQLTVISKIADLVEGTSTILNTYVV